MNQKNDDERLVRRARAQTLVTLINEEALLLAKYLRNEKEKWTPRVTVI